MKNHSFRLTVVIAMFVNLVGPALAPLPAAAAPAPASLGALPSWFAPASAATSEPEAALPAWFSSAVAESNPAVAHPASRILLPAWFSPPNHPNRVISSNNLAVSGPAEINNCDPVTFTIVAANNSFTTTNVIITSTMPGDFTPLSSETCSYSTVTPNETITCTVTYQAGCDAVSGQNVVTLTQSEHSPIVQRTEFTVLPGAITLRKVPSVIPAAVGDVVTWTVIVENTGYGRVDNVAVTDTLGTGLEFVSGALSASTASLAVGDFLTFTVSARVTECTGLDNDVEATWGCPDQTCQTHTAQASIDLQLDAPYLDYTLPNFDIDYCVGSGVFTIPVNNSGLGDAHNVVLSATNMMTFSVTPLSPGATYTPGVGFSLPDITGQSDYDLVCELAAVSPCSLSPSGGNFEFELQFDDDCGNPYVLPVKQKNWSLSGDVPSLSISKEMPNEIYLGEAVTPTITVEAAHVDYGPVIVTDTLPPGWTVVDSRGGNVFTVTGQVYITWTVSGNSTTVLTPVIRSPIVSGTGVCDYCGGVAQNLVEVRATDCQTCTHYADDTAATQIQCEDILNSHGKSVSPVAAETCTGFVYTSTYIFASFDVTPTWAGMVFTDDLPYQTYVTGSASIQLSNGPTNCAAVFSETISDGRLVISNISPTCSISVPNTTMEIVFQSAITAPSGCEDMTFYDWSRLDLGVTGNGICADDGILEEGVYVSVDAPQMALGISGIPANVEPCAGYTITLTLTRLGDAPAKDVALRFDTVDYAIVDLLGFGGLTPYFTHTDALSRTWFYSDDFTTATTATVYLRVQRHCDAIDGALAHAWYEGNCEGEDDEYFEECYINNGANPPVLEPSLIVAKYPELYYADDDVVTWTLTLINSGPATAREIILTDTLGAGLRYYTSTITTTRGSVAGVIPDVSPDERLITWTLHEVASGAQVTIKFVAEIVSCEDLTNEFSGWQSCLDETCLHEGPKNSYVLLPDTVLINTNNALSPLYTCLTRTITATVKNAGLMSVYSATVTETLPSGMTYVTGTTRYVIGSGATPPPTGWIAGGEPDNGPLGPLMWSSDQITNLAQLYPHETVWVVFDVRAGCEFEGGNITIKASYRDVCDVPQYSSASHFAMNAEPPEVTASKVGRNLTTSSDWGNPTVAEPGDTVQWRITVDNSGGSDAPDTVVTDTLPSNTTFVSAVPTPTFQSGNLMVWDIGTLAAHTSRVFTITATVNMSECAEVDTTNVVTAVWGCPDPACRQETTTQATLRTRPVFDEFSLTTNLPPATLHRCGGPITITLTNNGAPAYDVVLTDTLPAGFTYSGTIYASTPPSGTLDLGGTVVYTWGVLPTGVTTLAFLVNSGGSGDCAEPPGGNNVINLSYDDANSCLATGPYAATDSTAIAVVSPTLEIEKTPVNQVADMEEVGKVVTWTITVSNTGSGDAPNVVVTDTVGDGFSDRGALPGSGGETPVIAGNVITWTPPFTLEVGQVWTAQVTATVSAGGVHTNTVDARGTCAAGCTYVTTDDTAYVTLLRGFSKWPDIQTGTIGSLAVFTFTTLLPDTDALYESLTLTDALPAGLGYVSSVLRYTPDVDGGGTEVVSYTPTITPSGTYTSGSVVWALGDQPGAVQINGVITAVIQDITANMDGVRLTNVLTMTYSDDGQPYVHTDTADVDVLEPLLHIGKSYVTPEECEATLLQDNFNDGNATGWDEQLTGWSVVDGVYQNSGNGSNRRSFAGQYGWTDYSYSAMIRSTDDDAFGLIFRAQSGITTTYYRFAWNLGSGHRRLERVVADSATTLASDSVPYEPDRWYHVEIRAEGSRLRVFVDSELIFDVVDTTFASGRIGVYSNSNDASHFDNILVTRLGNMACLVGAGDHVTYTLTISNQSRIPGYDLVITDALPAGLSFLTYTLTSDDSASTALSWPAFGETGDLNWLITQLTATSPFSPLNHTALTLTVVLTVSDEIAANVVLPNQASLAYSSQFGPGPVVVERDYSGGSHSTAVRTVNGGIVKSVQFSPPPTATLGTLVTYTLILPASPITATLYDVVVTDTVDSRLRIEDVDTGGGANPSSGWSGQVVTAAFDNIWHGTQAVITVTARISHEWPSAAWDANDGETITNSARMIHATAPVTETNEVNTDVYEPDVSVVKSVESSTAITTNLDGAAFLTYTLQLVNNGTSPAYSIYITDAIPAGISVTAQYGGDARSGPVVGADTLTWTVGYLSNIAPGNSLLLTYTARITQAASNAWLTNIADILYHSLTDTIPGVRPYTDTGSADVETAPPEIAKATEPITLHVGDIVTYHLVFTIPAGAVGMGGSSYLRDTLPPGVWYMTDTESLTWTPIAVAPITFTDRAAGAVGNSQVVTWTFGQPITSTRDQPTVITLTFQAQAVGEFIAPPSGDRVWWPTHNQIDTITDTVGLWQRGTLIGEDDASNQVIQPDLDIDKESVPPSGSYVSAGDTITYTLTIANSGHGPAYDIMVRDWLPSGIEYVRTISAPNPSTALITPVVSGQRITYTVSELAAGPGATMVITIVAQVSDTIGANLVLTNTAAIPYYDSQPGDGPGPHTPDERDYIDGSDSVYHLTVDSKIEKGVTPSAATLGSVITYTIRVPQPPITATLYSVTVTDELSGALQLRTVVTGGVAGSVAIAGNAFTVTYPSIPAGQQRFITVTAVLSSPLDASAGDLITNLAVLEHQDGGPTPSEEPPFTVTEPSLTLVKASDPPTSNTVRAGDSVTYTVAITNWSDAYASPAYDVAFTDTLPAGMRDAAPTLITVTLNGAAVDSADYEHGYNSGVFTVTFTPAFSIPVGGALEIQYVAIVDSDVAAAQDLTNTAQVSWSSLPGPVDGDRDYGPEEDDTTVHTPPANALSKGVVPLTITIGSQVVFSATLPDPPEGVVLRNVLFTDVVDARLSIGGVFATGGASWGVDGQTVTATWTSIPTYTQRYVYITTTLRHMPTTTMGTQITNVAIFSHDMLTAPVESNVVTTTIIYDWGDLPDGYSTLLSSDGPRHVISPTLYLGSLVDAEGNGQPSIGADGDDILDGSDDEDGVEWSTLILGRNSTFTITASADNGYLNGWADFNADGDFDDAGERIISATLLSTDINTFTVMAPATTTSITASVYMRFRYSTQQDLQPDGAAPDGEVEDYVAATIAYDWGDLPELYPTLLSSDGARHVISDTFYLGTRVDAEGDGQPSLGADGDDNTNTSGVGTGLPGDDEDGVEWQPLVLGRTSIFTITASASNGYLNGWIDFNADGDLDDAGERVISGAFLNAGDNTFSIPVPTTATITSTTYMRFRYSTQPTLQPTGEAPDGEVEDYVAPLTAYDFGDLPQGPYSTTLSADGPRHVITPTNNPTLGDTVDAEGDGQPSANADGDDNTLTPDDEDGVQLDSTLIAGEVTTLTITATNVSGASLNAWIDFDGDGVLEQIFTNTTLSEGANTLTFTVPTVVLSDTLNGRFRYSSDSGLTPTGPASDGEVEDHQFEPTRLDWGDLPEGPYPTTLAQNGARHVILDAGNPTLGTIVDAELDGQPSINADGDDINGDDEDGVAFSVPSLIPGEIITITVSATATTGLLNAWLDFDGNGSLTDSGEQIAANVTITAGESVQLPVLVPVTATQGITTYARFRFSTQSDLTPTGLAWSGEVEDYVVRIHELDYGDAPNLNYSTVYTSDGARHIILPANNPTLGSIVDAETDGAPSFWADGDGEDEDGVTFDSELVPGEVATITVSAAITGSNGVLNAWIDFDIDGDWSEASDHIVANLPITAGTSLVITFTVPSTATQAATYARFRFSTQSGLTPTGLAPDGEIEDYIVGVKELDYGDAPDSYSTRFSDDGARHIITGTNPTLGSSVDDELDGAPSPGADGDDTANTDDEDGVIFGGDLVPGEVAVITVTAAPTATGILNAWIDFDRDGNWDQPIDQIVTNLTIISGTSVVITFTVPLTASQGITTYARFRFSTQPDLTPIGLAPDGEVEDYALRTLRLDYGDAPEPTYPTYRASDGPRHIILDADNPTLGATVDAESNGQPNGAANGDDTGDAPPDDEDGVRLDSTLIAGQVTTLTITATNVISAYLNVWIDFDGDGVYEQVFTDTTTLISGTNTLTFTVPTVVLSDTLNARFRYSTDSGLTTTGLAQDGEVEDHQFEPTPLDWGDLPQVPYPTRIISDGARHIILDAGNPTLGASVDAELDGQPSINADGDDINGTPDDEDGVTFSGPSLIPGEVITITVSAAITGDDGILNAWLDFDGNGSLTDSGEQIAANVTITAGESVQLVVPVPVTATQGITTYARFRFSTQGDLAPTGLASDGEIEDYVIPIRELEYGDLPDGPYPTLRDSDGARHIFDGVTYLGSLIDTETDGQPSVNADGDDNVPAIGPDDEDGVTFITPLMQGQPAQILVEAGSNGYLNAWIDFDGDGALDTINVTAIDGTSVISTMNDISMTTGVHTFTISVPDLPISSSVYSRFRFTSYDTNGALSYTGLASDGEVEDYVLMSLGNFVWHDNGSGGGVRNDGMLNGSEAGIPGVELELYRYDQTPGVDTPITTTTTDAGGYYMFTGLTPYTYVVHIPASEFSSGEPLYGLLSSTGWGIPDSDLDQDVDENGVDNPTPATGGVSSLAVTLSLGDEPTSEDGDANSNLTVDFGFYGGRIGDYVWLELVRDGEQNGLFENPIPGVVVDLYDSTTGAHLASDTTDSAGLYLFDDLPLNVTYTVQLSQVNFAPGGPLYPYTPTIFMVGPPATPITDSDGSPDAIFNGFGYAVTTTLTSVISEDLTLDFGFHAEPELELVKTVAPGAAACNMPFTYSIRIENTGQVTFTAMRLTDTLPADFYYIDHTGVPTDANTIAEPLLVWNDLVPVAGVLPPGGSLTVSFAVTATPGITGTYWNTATVRVETTPGDVLTDTDNAPVDIRDPAVTINKEILGLDRDGVAPDYVTFTIAITNVGPSLIDVLPMMDQYDPYYLSFENATPYPEQDADDGLLTWNDLTGPAPYGFGRNLAPGDTFHIVTVFNIGHEINVTTTNIVTVADVIDLYDNPANEDEDEKEIGGQEDDDDVPTAIEVLYFRAVGEEASVRLEWATAAELALDGFHVYRAPSASFGDAQTIAYLPATGPGSEYSHVDRDVTAGQVYWYWLVEEVSAGDPDTYGPAQGGAGIDSLPYHLYLPLIQKELGEQSATPSPHWADWLLGHWSSLWAGLLPESRRM